MLSIYKAARTLATWTGLTLEKAGPALNEVKNNLIVHRDTYAYSIPESEPGETPAARASNGVNLCLFLQSHGIKASLSTIENTKDKVILFQGYSANTKDSKEQLVGLLSAVEVKVGIAQAAQVPSGCSLRRPSSN